MAKLVQPKVFYLGCTEVDEDGLQQYLLSTGNGAFMEDYAKARNAGLSSGEALCSFYAKLCYASLTVGKNDNVTKTRSIVKNLEAVLESAHGSVLEHLNLSFVVSDCSRVYTHEQVRHRAGAAYSQTSGRYVRALPIAFVMDPILASVKEEVEALLEEVERRYRSIADEVFQNDETFERRKKLTSALRRVLPNGQANEMGMTLNVRTLRHCLQVRTSRHAEWEIRTIYAQVYSELKKRFPLMVSDAREEVVDGIVEVSGMRMQPYDRAHDQV